MQTDRSPAVLLGSAKATVGVGVGFLPGVHVDLVIDAYGTEPPDVDERLIARADAPGWFMTSHRIGARVSAGEVVGHLGRQSLLAPAEGVLRGLAARGARVHPGTEVIEVDPRGDPASCFGLGQRQRLIAANVVKALAARGAHCPGFVTNISPHATVMGIAG
jgi:xanthine dehydrogenase accessory factor